MSLLRETALKLLLLLALPLFLVLALALLPVALLAAAWSERRRRCPNCGLRGTLHDVTPPRPPMPEDGNWRTTLIPRVVTTRVWRCEVCGATFEGTDGQPLRQVS